MTHITIESGDVRRVSMQTALDDYNVTLDPGGDRQ